MKQKRNMKQTCTFNQNFVNKNLRLVDGNKDGFSPLEISDKTVYYSLIDFINFTNNLTGNILLSPNPNKLDKTYSKGNYYEAWILGDLKSLIDGNIISAGSIVFYTNKKYDKTWNLIIEDSKLCYENITYQYYNSGVINEISGFTTFTKLLLLDISKDSNIYKSILLGDGTVTLGQRDSYRFLTFSPQVEFSEDLWEAEYPKNIKVNRIKSNSFRILWDSQYKAKKYIIRWRQLNTNTWNYYNTTLSDNIIVSNLIQISTQYEIQVMSIFINNKFSTYSNSIYFSTLAN